MRISTGEVAIEDFIVVHDCGTIINPAIVEGQVHGGVAQGIAGAMYEHFQYDAETADAFDDIHATGRYRREALATLVLGAARGALARQEVT